MIDRLRLIFRAWKYRLRIDPAEIAYLLRIVRPGDRVVDAGAHKGAYSYWMSKAAGHQGEVVAFEPQPALAVRLTHLAMRNVTVENMALSAAAGEMTLHVPGAGPSPGATLEAREGGSYHGE